MNRITDYFIFIEKIAQLFFYHFHLFFIFGVEPDQLRLACQGLEASLLSTALLSSHHAASRVFYCLTVCVRDGGENTPDR